MRLDCSDWARARRRDKGRSEGFEAEEEGPPRADTVRGLEEEAGAVEGKEGALDEEVVGELSAFKR